MAAGPMDDEQTACKQEAEGFSPGRGLSPRQRNILVITETAFVLALIIVWLLSGGFKSSTNLLVLFLYSFPSEFLMAIMPHEPVLIYFGKFFSPATVMAVALSSTLIVELTNYFVIGQLFDLRALRKVKASPLVDKATKLFLKAPFPALVFFAFAPIIFYPFRFLTVLSKYPARKYILAVALGRGPRFFLLALLGRTVEVPAIALILFTLCLLLMGAIPYTRSYLKKRRLKARHLQEADGQCG